ncbi:MAG TPA: N-acetyltransferase family protein, partial [Lentisphaeria bacterium]|nr:N-acetyltransferase family protein [Lentisphaeria bacterium]
MNEYTIRPFQPGDLPALTELYNHYILHTTATF